MRSSPEGMARVFAVLLIVHGLIHLLGFAKGFHFAELPQLTQPISPLVGTLWLTASLLFLATALSLFACPRWWWALGAISVGVSMPAISQSWTDARVGALANLVILIGVVFGFLVQGPFSLRAAYERDVKEGLARSAATRPIGEADLAGLPPPVQRYLRKAGVVGQPRVLMTIPALMLLTSTRRAAGQVRSQPLWASVRATEDECSRPLPGDERIPQAIDTLTHGVTIRRSPHDVWPWLAQMGAGSRGGWYSYDWLDNGRQPSAARIVPELQHPAIGTIFPALPGMTEGFTVLAIEHERGLTLGWRRRRARHR